ncbi:hypothetical protein [Teredinibacter sp. KSP-S5-2]|uniref:hypothetical protein n=1 Tax=Teredinibacter sp. KSP-S5-2 TaxID=3034506 RepID=UPI002934BFD9|nr:hypothetical protein [Teredinibacter sp. KSP-S5-2]WNO07653.1 hypothetical protein P5V12_11695 [Teredinibacter sp. KSP-S5-2]
MQSALVAAAIIAAFVGCVHSILGEMLVFSKLRNFGVISGEGVFPLKPGSVRILWATWHLVSVFGWTFSAILLTIALDIGSVRLVVLNAIGVAFLVGCVLVLVATKGRHPGWFGLLIVGALIFISQTF